MRQSIYLLLCLLGISACVDQIEFEVEPGLSSSLSIHGRLSLPDDPEELPVFTLSISNVFDFNSAARKEVSVRYVNLIDEEGRVVEVPNTRVGTYEVFFDESIPIKPRIGGSYFVELETFNSKRYRSAVETIAPVIDPANFDYSLEEIEGVDKDGEPEFFPQLSFTVDLNVPTDGDAQGILWETERVWKISDDNERVCYITESPGLGGTQPLFDPIDLEDVTTVREEVLTLPINAQLSEGNLITLKQSSLSREALVYYRNINTLLSKNGSMFDAPASRITTNWTNIADPDDLVFGYFFATHTKTRQIQLPPRLFEEISNFCPLAGPPGGGCDICCNCLEVNQSQLTPPKGWVN